MAGLRPDATFGPRVRSRSALGSVAATIGGEASGAKWSVIGIWASCHNSLVTVAQGGERYNRVLPVWILS